MAFEDFKVANYSKALLSPELFARHFSRFLTGDVIDGLTVTPGSGLQVVLAPGNALLRYGSSAVASARLVSLVNNFNLTIDTADASNPRIDLVVVYVDNAVSLPSGTPTSANLDGPGVAKAKIVKGTAASSPAAPNATAVQASVGAGNPYTVVAQVRVNAGVTVIASDRITDVRSLARLTADKLDSATLPLGDYTDANGWKVKRTLEGKVYTKRVTFSQSFSTTAALISLSSNSLPVGVANISNVRLSAFVSISSGNAYDFLWGSEMAATNGTLSFSARSGTSTRTYTGFIDIVIVQ